MNYIKNLENKTQSVLSENIADDAAEISGLDKDAVADAIKGLNFSSYLELGNAVTVEDGETIRMILDVIPEGPMKGKSGIVRDVAKEKGFDYVDMPMSEADNPSAPAAASPTQPAVTPPSAGSSIDALAQPADTAVDIDNQEVQQGRKEIEGIGSRLESSGGGSLDASDSAQHAARRRKAINDLMAPSSRVAKRAFGHQFLGHTSDQADAGLE